MNRTLALLIAAMAVLAAVTPELVRLLAAGTPLVVVLVVSLIAWRLVQHFTRR